MSQGFFDVHAKLTRPAEAQPTGNAPLTVSQLTVQIEKAIKVGVPSQVLVRGEVSNHKFHNQSGHHYFTLKDEGSCIPCVMFKSDAGKLRFQPRDGLELLATGRVGVYPQQGKYQLYVTSLSSLGQGALELALQQMRAKLEAAGLFAADRKRSLPAYPAHIGLVTGINTAAIQDIFKVLSRYRFLKISVYNVPVQGDGAAEKIADALRTLNQHRESIAMDVIILARGGGSLEDLWEFNEECVARAIRAGDIPVVTGIGHEIDTSIADLAADYFAHTPTEAAQVIAEHWKNAWDIVDTSALRLRRGLTTTVNDLRQQLASITRHEFFRRPVDRINQLRQLVDDRQRGLSMAMLNQLHGAQRTLATLSDRLQLHRPQNLLIRRRQVIDGLSHRLSIATQQAIRKAHLQLQARVDRLHESHPRHRLRLLSQKLENINQRLKAAVGREFDHRRQVLSGIEGRLSALSPQSVFQRGYTMTTNKKTSALIRNADELREGDRIVTQFAKGKRESIVQDAKQLPLFE